MKKRILLPAICMVISLFATSCSSDDSEYTAEKEPMVTLTVSAGTDEDAPESRAVLSEADASTSPWKWETGDQLLVVSTNSAGKKVASKLKLKSTKNNDRSGEFEGEVPASGLTTGTKYRFFYIGKTADGSADRAISDDEANAGSINIDLTSQTGNLADLKRNCVLTGEAKINVSNGKATVAEGVKLSNVFAVAHFNIKANDGTTITKVGLRGKGVYRSAKVNLANGSVTGESEVGIVADPEDNIFFNDGKTDFYVTFVPGNVAPSFDGYYADSYKSALTEEPQTRNYDERESFVYYGGAKAKFSVGNGKYVAITNGNMQYVMPIVTYTYDLGARNLKANSLIRWKNSVALKLSGVKTVQPGYYRLAPEQWEMAMPKASRKNATYDIETIKVGDDLYASPEKYRIFDLPSWGTLDKPTLLHNTFSATSDEEVKKYDYGHKLKVGNQETRVMTSDEWEYLMPEKIADSSLPNTARVWNEDGKQSKWARCHIKATSERADDPVWLRGCLIFPDDMPISKAKELFTSFSKFGYWSKADYNETTFEKIRNSGAVFIPLTAYREGGKSLLKEWGRHGNYATSSRNFWKRVLHVKITPLAIGIGFRDASDPNQGCAVRLVQDY